MQFTCEMLLTCSSSWQWSRIVAHKLYIIPIPLCIVWLLHF